MWFNPTDALKIKTDTTAIFAIPAILGLRNSKIAGIAAPLNSKSRVDV